MTGLAGDGTADLAATWVAAIATIIVLGGLLGERRLFGWSQHLFAGLATGFLALLAVTEVIVPRIIAPIVASPAAAAEAWLGLALVGLAAAVPWLPRTVAAVPLGVAIGALAAFAFGGAVIGTLLPQLAATVAVREGSLVDTGVGIIAAGVSVLVIVGFLHGAPRAPMVAAAARAGRWLLLGGLGGWLGYLILSRLVLLVDRVAFLLTDWLGIGR